MIGTMPLTRFYAAARAYFPGYEDTAFLETIWARGCVKARKRRNRKTCLAANAAVRHVLNQVTPCVYCSVCSVVLPEVVA